MTDPNLLLSNFRDAVTAGHNSMAILSAVTLDAQITGGGELPDAWKQEPTP